MPGAQAVSRAYALESFYDTKRATVVVPHVEYHHDQLCSSEDDDYTRTKMVSRLFTPWRVFFNVSSRMQGHLEDQRPAVLSVDRIWTESVHPSKDCAGWIDFSVAKEYMYCRVQVTQKTGNKLDVRARSG